MIELAPFTPGDFDTLLGWIPDERFLRQWAGRPFVHPLDRSQLEAHLANASDARPFRVNHAGSGEMIGYAELSAINPQRRARIGRNHFRDRIHGGVERSRNGLHRGCRGGIAPTARATIR